MRPKLLRVISQPLVAVPLFPFVDLESSQSITCASRFVSTYKSDLVLGIFRSPSALDDPT